MSIDTQQKRMSALNPSSPWRGPLVDAPAAGFDISSRAAAMFLYGLIAGAAVGQTIFPPFFVDLDTLYPPFVGLGEPPQNYPPQVSMRSGFRVPNSRLVREWTGLMVSQSDLDQRNPQDFVRGRKERPQPRFLRPEAEDVFLDPNDVTADDL